MEDDLDGNTAIINRDNVAVPCIVDEKSEEEILNENENVVIIQSTNENSTMNDLEDLDPSVIKYVKQLLMESDGQQSVIIVNQDGSSEQTYQLGLQSLENNEKIGSSDLQSFDHSGSKIMSPEVHKNTTSSIAVDSSSQTTVKVSSQASDTTITNVSTGMTSCHDIDISSEILLHQSDGTVETISFPSRNLTSCTDTFLPSTSGNHQTSIAVAPSKECAIFNQNSLPQTSGAAEHLLDIAHKMIGKKKPDTKLSSKLTSNTSILSSEVSSEGKSYMSESVITMYLSSPRELKNKLEDLKDNSPVVVLQAQNSSFPLEEQAIDSSEEVMTDISHPVKSQADLPGTSSLISRANIADSVSKDESAPEVPETGNSAGRDGEECVYRCQECGYSSHNKHYYKQHVDLVHNEDRPYKCPHCDYAGKRRHALLEHMVVHSNNRPFTCGHCNASFRKKGHLTNHIKLHTSQRLVHCGVCNIQLPDSEAFEAHLRKIHKTDKLYKCKLCEHTVVDREAMIKHFQTHNEMVFYACPICDSQFSGESSLEEHLKNIHGSVSTPSSSSLKSVPMNSSHSGKDPKTSTPNIMCSECGFVCCDQEVMQKHLWAHIKHDISKDSTESSKTKSNESSKENSMGVLKKNIDLGQKTLPKDVFYQCTSCAFTSSDNSAFIKHMLAHKTQDRHHREVSAESSSLLEAKVEPIKNGALTPVLDATKMKPSLLYTEVISKSIVSQEKADNSVPFVYDKASARFRCLICNYHCEFQRTIKAHIWKHSGHQSIEYPMFDQSGNATSGPQVKPSLFERQHAHSHSHPASISESHEKQKSGIVTLAPSQKPLPVFKTRSGEMVHLLPVDPANSSYKPGELIQIKDNTVIVPEKMGKTSAVSRFLESIVLNKPEDISQTKVKSQPEKVAQTEGQNVKEIPEKSESSESKTMDIQPSTSMPKSAGIAISQRGSKKDDVGELKRMEDDISVGCTEPSVVVEVMDTIPPGSGLTGMKSQQGSPRVSDLDSSGGDSKFSTQLRSAVLRSRDNSADSDTSISESEPCRSGKSAELSKRPTNLHGRNHHSYSTKLRCPFCDCHVTEDLKQHLMNCKVKNASNVQKDDKGVDNKKGLLDEEVQSSVKEDVCESYLAEDTDSTESSDETSAGDATNSKKSGICSSLLAVIEQLRERSRSESEEDRQGSQMLKKQNRKKGRQADVRLESIDDLKNIEKISENNGYKFRCVLCHYTSERIYNIKLHMKTHRQKKPTECSLCDFSSASPEALQEHMLKHCKVRTYACKFCPQNFNHKSTLRAHMRAHKDQEPYLCAYCVFETSNTREYQDHMQVHSGCSSRLRCPGCDLVLGGKDELTAHLLGCKGKKGRIQTRASAEAGSKGLYEQLTDAGSSATDCEANLLDDNLQQSKQEESQSSEQIALAAPKGSSAPQNTEPPTQHACVVQGCIFTSASLKDLQEHLSVHCNPSLLMCNLCDFKAWHSRSLKSHMKRHANDQRYVQQPLEQYKCNLCGYVCHHLPSLKSHMWRHASDQSYSYEFTNDVINAAIDHDNRVDAGGEADDPELLDQVINSERKILEGELTKCKRGDGQRPICWVTFRCCSCGFETINKAKLNIHMRTHSDLIQQAQALDIIPRRKRSGVEEKPQANPPAKVIKTEH
ncbi:Zinc finger protein 507-like [Plakobranchus ocellatus]|uniref:Zinc finger protein 507-like n=1 Tax=Plakobranchus ocellatus TaxID=259542 RepID=A0AAV3ZBL2_9GAST|nr:Zinc finger protein 507-like [Plakobranchus ocellatus]